MKIKCPSCNSVLDLPDSAAGTVVKCSCGKSLRAPAPRGSNPAAAQPPARGSQPTARRGGSQGPAATQRREPASVGGVDPGIFDELSESDLQGVKPVTRPGTTVNPYEAPGSGGPGALAGPFAGGLASLGKRFVGALLDGLISGFAFAFGYGVFIGVAIASGDEPAPVALTIAGTIGAIIALIPVVVNAVWITNSGQSIGKKLIGTRIVMQATRHLPGFGRGVALRSWLIFLLGQIIPFFALIDVLFIFGEERRCLHDRMAGTIVIDV